MRILLIVVRLFLVATAVVSCVAAISVGATDAGARLLADDPNTWSGLLGMFVAGGAGISIVGAISPNWVLAHPAGAMFALVPLVALVLIEFYSSFENALTLNLALLGALCSLVALLLQPPAALFMSKNPYRQHQHSPDRSSGTA